MRCYQREKRIICGRSKKTAKYQEVKIYPMTGTEACREYDRGVGRKPRGTPEAQKKHNAKAAREFYRQLVNTNFTPADTHSTLTWADEYLPSSVEQAERDYTNFLRHATTKCKARGLPKPEALAVIEYREADPETGQRPVRFHIHVLMRCGLTRDEIENCWHRKGQRLGRANADRLQMDKESLEALASYLLKYTNRKHRWKRTRGIKSPIVAEPRDGKYTRRQVERIAKDSAILHSPEFWARKYPGWELNEAEATYNEFTGWYISLKMRRRNGGAPRGG